MDRLARGVFRSVPELATAIKEYIAVHNQNPKPFVWKAKAGDILQKTIRANRQLGSKKSEALQLAIPWKQKFPGYGPVRRKAPKFRIAPSGL
jgi:hypothetical protein